MSNTNFRIALPGYNPLTDTDLDHYALYVSDDPSTPLLIKEFTRGSKTIGVNSGSPPEAIAHNLGYIPFHLVYAKDPVSKLWRLIPHYQSPVTVPQFSALVDQNNLYISNFDTTTDFKWLIFYDNIVGSSSIQLTESNFVLKWPRPGYNAVTEKDPNKLIFHSDLNTLKILKEGNATVTSSGSGSYNFSHNSPAGVPTIYMLYCQFPDGTTAFISSGGIYSKNVSTQLISDLVVTSTDFQFTLGSSGDYLFKYFIFEMPLDNDYTIPLTPETKRVSIAKSNFNVLTETHPNNLRFDSRFNTLKYYLSDFRSVTCSGNNEDKTVEVTIPNTWGMKAFIVYVDDIFIGSSPKQYAFVPHVSSTISTIHEASAYMDRYNLYLKLRIKESGAFNYTANFYYKIFENKLNLP